MKSAYSRLIALVGERAFQKLASARVLVVGLGGVGGAALETLARYGVGFFALVDGDVFEPSNLNRQLLCTEDTIGKNKAIIAAERVKSISPQAKCEVFDCYYSSDTAQKIMRGGYDHCIDAIDDVDNKVALIADCKSRNIPVISAMGAGNRLDSAFGVVDIHSTTHDFLARSVRKKLRERGITDVPAVCACAPSDRPETDTPQSASPLPSCAAPPIVMGATLAGYVAKRLMGL